MSEQEIKSLLETTSPQDVKNRLNPCLSGRWSLTYNETDEERLCGVLILVLVEYGL